jgi:hypothetical protein
MKFMHECFRELLKESVNGFNRPNLRKHLQIPDRID